MRVTRTERSATRRPTPEYKGASATPRVCIIRAQPQATGAPLRTRPPWSSSAPVADASRGEPHAHARTLLSPIFFLPQLLLRRLCALPYTPPPPPPRSFCFEAAANAHVNARVLLLEANAHAVAALRQRFATELSDGSATLVHHTLLPHTTPAALPDACRPFLRACNVVVSELLGVAGDNEFMPELLAAARRLFLARGGISVPAMYTVWAAPLQCPLLHKHIGRMDRAHITGLPPAAHLLAPARPVYSRRCDRDPGRRGISASVTWDLRHGALHVAPAEPDPDTVALEADEGDWPPPLMASPAQPHTATHTACHGFLLWFTSRLYKDVVIDTRFTSAARNAFHWEAWLLPVSAAVGGAEPGALDASEQACDTVLRLDLRRTVAPTRNGRRLRLSYSWRCQGCPWTNADGSSDGVEIG